MRPLRERIQKMLGLVLWIALAARAEAGPAPAPAYDLQRGVRISMRDGTALSANLYRPRSVDRLPAILVRTPYGKDSVQSEALAALFATHGYMLVVEDKRGRFESDGEYIVGDHEISDSYDTIDWIAHQPWSNGRVGAYGCSDPGDAAIYAAVSGHPALKAVIPEAAGSTNGPAGGLYRYFGVRNGGAVELAMGVGWMVDNGTRDFLKPPPGLPWDEFIQLRPHFRLGFEPSKVDYDRALSRLPVIGILKAEGLTRTDWENLVGRELSDPWFAHRDFLRGDERPTVPALHVNSWYDFAPGVTLWQQRFFKQRAGNPTAAQNQFLVMSPSLHCQSTRMTADFRVGDRPMGDPRIPLTDLYLRWFDHWLKLMDNGVTAMPKVQYFMMGENRWRAASVWPDPAARRLRLYLAGEQPNGPEAAGRLVIERPRRRAPSARFIYDPADAVPSVGGSLCCIHSDKLEGAYDQRGVERRPDVLTFSTPPLRAGVFVAGPVRAELSISSSAPDTDFTAKLVDVYPDGTAFNLQEGILRVRGREGLQRSVLMERGKTYRIAIDLQDVANYFGPGHRIRLEISSSNFPRFDRNLNTGGRNFDEVRGSPAANTVHMDAAAPSSLVLYVLPR